MLINKIIQNVRQIIEQSDVVRPEIAGHSRLVRLLIQMRKANYSIKRAIVGS